MPRTIGSIVLVLALGTATAAVAAARQPDQDSEYRSFVRGLRLPVPRQPAATSGPGPVIDAGRGPIPVHVPPGYDPGTPTPLVILLHGYTSNGPTVESWMQLTPLADEFGFLYLYPTGTTDIFGQPFWNATDACCDLWGANPDDSGYLRAVIDTMRAVYNVDERRIHFVGHSNGGFMSYRMACDHADVVASIASLAGATFLDPSDCTPSEPVATLQIHGTADGVIAYDGGCIPFGGCHPGAVQTTETWATYDGCTLEADTSPPPLDLVTDVPGAESTVTRYATGCNPGGSAELWTIAGGVHSPNLAPEFGRRVVEFLFAHPKPAPCPADLDGNGAVAFADLLALLGAWGPCPGCPADLDGDGSVAFSDVLLLIGAWGDC